MKQYYFTDGKAQFGPFSLEVLLQQPLTASTKVWAEGMADWTDARSIPELASLFNTPGSVPPPPPQASSQQAPPDFASQTPLNNPTLDSFSNRTHPPKTWLLESILVTLFCCLPFGIAGIVFASRVESKFYAGDHYGAEQASADAGKWTKIGFFSGLTVIVLYLVFIFVVVGAGFMNRNDF